MTTPVAIVAGAGPGLGAAIARRFAKEGYGVAVIARSTPTLTAITSEIAALGGTAWSYVADLGEHDDVRQVIGDIIRERGTPSVLVWNAASWTERSAVELDPLDLDRQFRLGLSGALTAMQVLLPTRTQADQTSILLTGGGLAINPGYGTAVPALTAVKSALRGFVHAGAPAFAQHGTKLATITVAGQIAPGTEFDPNTIAEVFWAAHTEAEFPSEFVFDGKARVQ